MSRIPWKEGLTLALFIFVIVFAARQASSQQEGAPQLTPGARAAIERLKTAPLPAAYHAMAQDEPDIRPFIALPLAEQAVFEQQWQAAKDAAPGLDTPAEALAAGYLPPQSQDRGKHGVHWINWELVMQPFDPAKPSMLIFTNKNGQEVLMGYSYTVQGSVAPEGFVSPNDVWHTHSGVCLKDGRVVKEGVPSSECVWDWIPGSDLWMMHAWILPEYPNPFGRFSISNPPQCLAGQECPFVDVSTVAEGADQHAGH